MGVYGCGLDGPDGSEARVDMNPDGTITVCSAWEDHGQGADIGAIGTAHEALRPLGIAPDKLRFTWPNTAKCPNSGPAGGSRSQVMTGNAIRVACETLLKETAKPKSGFFKKDGGYMTYDELVAAGKPTSFAGKWSAVDGTACDENSQGKPFVIYMYGVFMAEVTVDTETGKTVVDRMTLMCDCGKINNRLVVDGQNYGGIAQGIGLALSEDFEDIEKHSTMPGAGFPYIKDIPDDIEVIYFEEHRADGPHGAAGIGELPLTSPHASVINGIYNACGVRITKLPAYPEKVLAALKK
ncbi:Aldehyde oxidoreductase [bioreactor metagenome]|uniref:Aldehyde oxidoreductase n=1 Tax=bioreactor metagenome TaxID=1076179 RepID=A0A645AD05_9ZZZZ